MPSVNQKFKNRCACYTHACGCLRRDQTHDLFLDNVADVAAAVAEVLKICGIHPCKAKGAIEVIVFAFMHYDDIRQRIDAVPRKRLCKTDVIHALSFKCLMTRMEAQLTYSILKRAFKAFYHGTDEGGLPNPILEAQLIHTQECLWVHAAKRSAQIFASYEGMFFMALRDYEARIMCVYKHLYDRMQARSDPAALEQCICPGCNRRMSANYRVPTEYAPAAWQMDPTQPGAGDCKDCATGSTRRTTNEMVQFEQPKHKASNVSIHLPRCKQCNCPDLVCNCDLDRQTYSLRGNYSQGPFKCIWFARDDFGKFPFEMEMDTPEPDHECPVDCAVVDRDREPLSCDSECECDCEVCSCEEDGGGDDDEELDLEAEAEGEIEPYDSTEEHALPKVPKGYMPVIWGDCREHDDEKEKVEEEEDGSDFALDLWKML